MYSGGFVFGNISVRQIGNISLRQTHWEEEMKKKLRDTARAHTRLPATQVIIESQTSSREIFF